MTADQVAQTLRTAVEGSEVTRLRVENETEVPIRLIASDAARANISTLSDLPLTGLKDGQLVTVQLRQVTTVEEVAGPTSLTRRNRENTITVGAALAGNVALTPSAAKAMPPR